MNFTPTFDNDEHQFKYRKNPTWKIGRLINDSHDGFSYYMPEDKSKILVPVKNNEYQDLVGVDHVVIEIRGIND